MSAVVMAAAKPVTPVVVVKSDFQIGWDVYAAGGADSDCTTPEQVRGWWHALDADCAGEMCSEYMGRQGMSGEQMDIIFDGLHLAYSN